MASSLFDINGFMRASIKSNLAKFLIPDVAKLNSDDGDIMLKRGDKNIVIDGGALLHKVGWSKNTLFSTIIENYVSHIRNTVGNAVEKSHVHVVFDGYLLSTTKDHCHLKRCPVKSMTQAVELDQKLLCKKQVFLSNPTNKQDD